jgi:PAS domain S-box-containing protein
MAASKKSRKEFIEEAQISHSRLEKLRRGKAKHKQMEDALKESKEHAKIFASYQQAISELRKFYVREAGLEQMLQKTADLFIKNFGYYMAWYGELHSDEKVIIPKVWAGKYEKYLDGLRLELDDSKDAKCAMSLAIVRKGPFGYADLEHDKDFEKWRPLALKYGYRSNQAIPLIINGKSVGAFLIYSTRPRAFSEDLIQYLVGIANELATIVENITGRKKAGEAYRALVDHSLQGLVIFQDGRVVFANQTMTEITGYALDKMLAASSQQVQARVHPEHRALVWSRHQERLRGKRLPERYEIRGIRQDGTICWLEIHASRIEYQGKPAVQAACVDITERKKAQEALRESEEKYRSIFNTAAGLITSVDRNGTILDCNARIKELLGYEKDEVAGQSIAKIMHPDYMEKARNCLDKILVDGFAHHEEFKMARKDNEIIDVEINAAGVKGKEGQYVGSICIIQDITERKEAEEAYLSLVDHSLQGLAIFLDGRVVFANQAMADITGFTVSEILNAPAQHVKEFVHPEDRTLVWGRYQDRLSGKPVPERYELRGIRKDGSMCWLEIHANRIEYQGKPAIQAAYVDITERKEAEEALQKRTEELTIINEMAIELAVASSTADIYKLVCEKLKSITGALFTGITSYDAQRQELKVEHISTDSKFITTANKILGRKVKELRVPLEPCNIEQMLTEKAKRLEGLNEMMFGTLSRAVVNTLERALRIGDVYGLVLHYGGKILGTMAILMPQKKPLLSIEMLEAFANLVATSLKHMKAEEERIAAVQERAAVVDAMSDSVIVLNPDGKIISCNPAHLKMFRRSSLDELLGRNFSELRKVFCDPEQDIPKMLEVFRGVVQNGISKPVEVRVRRADGDELTVSASVSLQRDAMGNPKNVVAILRDITPQKRLQKMEREAAVTRMAVEMIEGMLEAVTIMNLDGIIRQVNSEFERGSGYKKEEVIGKTAIELGIISKEEGQRIEKEIIPKLMNEGLVRNTETVVMSKDGTRFPALMSWRLMKDAQGNPKGIIATVTDITERKHVEEELEQSKKFLAHTINALDDPFFVKDEQHRWVILNDAACEVMGHPREELIGKNDYDLFPKEQADVFWEKDNLVFQTQETNINEEEITWHGEIHTISTKKSPFTDSRTGKKFVAGTIRDITELKRAEEQLREYQRKLQSMASELSLTEEREKRSIATGLHDRIVQPLVFAKMKLDELESLTTSADSGKHLEEISNMLDQVIEETQTLTYDLGSPTLYELGLEAAVEEWLSEEIEQKHNISTFFEAEDAPESLSEDISGFLFRSVRELLINAVKHGKAHSIKVSLRGEGDKIRICVDDDGVGFELSQAGVSRDKKCGYGLFSIKEHLSHIGGYIDIKSKPNHGTQVVLVAPSKAKSM